MVTKLQWLQSSNGGPTAPSSNLLRQSAEWEFALTRPRKGAPLPARNLPIPASAIEIWAWAQLSGKEFFDAESKAPKVRLECLTAGGD